MTYDEILTTVVVIDTRSMIGEFKHNVGFPIQTVDVVEIITQIIMCLLNHTSSYSQELTNLPDLRRLRKSAAFTEQQQMNLRQSTQILGEQFYHAVIQLNLIVDNQFNYCFHNLLGSDVAIQRLPH